MAPQNESSIGEKLVSDFIFGNRLLVIDDELAVCRPIQKIAERCGFEVVITDNPETFVRKAQCWKPTVIVLDLQMPMMDGIELLRELAADGCEAHVIVSSGADARVLDAAMQLGHQRGLKMNGILQKPYRAEYLRKIFSGLAKISKEQLRDDLAREAVTAFIDQLRSGAKIEKFNIDGSKPDPAAAKPATPAAPAPAAPPK